MRVIALTVLLVCANVCQTVAEAREEKLLDVLRRAAALGPRPIVTEVVEPDRQIEVPAEARTQEALLAAFNTEQDGQTVPCGPVAVPLSGVALDHHNRLVHTALAVEGWSAWLSALPAERTVPLAQEACLDYDSLAAAQQELARYSVHNFVVDRDQWAAVTHDNHIAVGVVADPYFTLSSAPGTPPFRYYVRDRWRYLLLDALQPAVKQGLLQAVGTGEKRLGVPGAPPRMLYDLFGRTSGGGAQPPAANWPEPERGGRPEPRLGPCDLASLGPVLAVRARLAQRQFESVANSQKSREVLARFEVVGAQCLDLVNAVRVATDGLQGCGRQGYRVRAVLCYALLDPQSIAPPTGSLVARWPVPQEGVSVASDGPRFARLRIEVVDYRVVPRNATAPQTQGATSYVLQTEWEAEDPPSPVRTETRTFNQGTKPIAIWDPCTLSELLADPKEGQP